MKKKIIFISGGRSDFDRMFSILNEINKSKKADLLIFLTSPYFDKTFDYKLKKIKKYFIVLNDKKKNYYKDDSNIAVKNLLSDSIKLNKFVENIKPSLIIVAGDRYDMLSGPIVAVPKNIPIVHFFGGAVTEGATDELVRHSISKLSHLHYVLLKDYKKRLKKMGEESWRIKVIGMPNLDPKINYKFKTKEELSKELKFNLNSPFFLATFHPVTLTLNNIKNQVQSFIKSIKAAKMKAIITYPNSDIKFKKIIKIIKKNFINSKNVLITKSLGEKKYFNLMKYAEFILGNSSSGIVEAAFFKLPSVNIGDRQKGKFLPDNVINVNYSLNSILNGIKRARSKSFKNRIKKMKNYYNSKISSQRIADEILNIKIDDRLLRKKFIN